MAYFKVSILFDKDPEPAPRFDNGYGANLQLFDIYGRTYRLGIRYNF